MKIHNAYLTSKVIIAFLFIKINLFIYLKQITFLNLFKTFEGSL